MMNHGRRSTPSSDGLGEWAATLLAQNGFTEQTQTGDYNMLCRHGMGARDAAASVREALEAASRTYVVALMQASTARASDSADPTTGRIAQQGT